MVDVICAIILVNDKVLVTQRSATMKMPFKWEFPGGKLESDESEIDCIKRELKEELNIEISIINKLTNTTHDYGHVQINLIPFVVKYLSGEIILAEHLQYKLLALTELEYLDWAEADLPVLKEFQQLNNAARYI